MQKKKEKKNPSHDFRMPSFVSEAGKLLQDLVDDLKQMSVKWKWFFPHVAVPKNVQFGSCS